MEEEIPKAGVPQPVAVPEKKVPTVKWDALGRVREPESKDDARAKQRARGRRDRMRALLAALDALETATQDPNLDCCGVVEVARNHKGAFEVDVIDANCCTVRNAITDMLRAAGRID